VPGGGERLDTVNDPRAGSGDDVPGGHRPHGHAPWQARQDGEGLGASLVEADAAGPDEHDIDIGVRDLFPRRGRRAAAGDGEHGLRSGRDDHVRDPVAGDERRVSPLQHEDARPRSATDAGRYGVQPVLQPGPKALAGVGHAAGRGHGDGAVEDVPERVRVECDDLGRLSEQGHGFAGGVRGKRAHGAEVLGEDDVGGERADGTGVEGVQRKARGDALPDQCVDRPGCQRTALGVASRQAVDDDGAAVADAGRCVALERDPDEPVVEAERADPLGPGRQQRHDP
jgi:hypothetical protein